MVAGPRPVGARDHAGAKRGVRARSLHAVLVAAFLASGAVASEGPRVAIHERAIDVDHDGYFDYLRIDSEVTGIAPGLYDVDQFVGPDSTACWTHAWFMYEITPDEYEAHVVRGEPWPGYQVRSVAEDDSIYRAGLARADSTGLRYSAYYAGDVLRSFGRDGPWRVCLDLSRDDGGPPATPGPTSYELSAPTRAWSHRRFASHPQYGDSVSWTIDPDSTTVVLTISVDTHRSDSLRVRAAAAFSDASGGYYAESTYVGRFRLGHSKLVIRLTPRTDDGRSPRALSDRGLDVCVSGPMFGRSLLHCGPCAWTLKEPEAEWPFNLVRSCFHR